MSAGNYTFVCEQGATFSRTLTWRDPNGDPIDLTGYSARMQVRPTARGATEPLVEITDGDGITLGGEEGTIALYVDADATASLPAEPLRYDIELEQDGNVTRLLAGWFKVVAEVTA